MILKPYYRPGSPEWLSITSLLSVIRVMGRFLTKEERQIYRLKGMLPKGAQVPDSLSSRSPDMIPDIGPIIRMPGTIDDASTAQGPYALHIGGGMYARQVRFRTYGVG